MNNTAYIILPVEDLRCKLQDLENLQENIRYQTRERSGQLEEALGVAEKFQTDYQEATHGLKDVQDNLASQDHPGIDPATIQEQLKELQV